MAIVWVNDDDMTSIANAIRTKCETTITYTPSQMAIALNALEVVKNDLASYLNKTITSYESEDPVKVRQYGFAYCLALHTVTLPNVTTIETHGLYMCRGLKHVSVEGVVTVGESAFSGCDRIQTITLPNVTSIGNYAFFTCTRLEEMILPGNTVCTLASDQVLAGTAIANGKGFIKVPSALLATYQAASGWSTYASQIVAIT